jgi:hypothetical protein
MKNPAIDGGQLDEALAKICAEARDGLRHGHFKLAVTCTLGNKGVRELVLEAGKTYRYRIAKEEL